MKKILITTITLGVMAVCTVSAQTNLNFENWTGNEPNGWVSSNATTQAAGGAQTVFEEIANPGQGTASVKMVTGNCPDCPNFNIFGFPAPLPNPLGGGIQLGTFDTPGIPYTQRPISVDFRYKSNPMNNDAGGIHIELTKDDTITIGEAYFEANTQVTNWTNMNIPIVYYSTLQPDRIDIYATSSIGSIPDLSAFGSPSPSDLGIPVPVAGSEFYLDAIVMNLPSCAGFDLSVTGTNETNIGANDGTASANPSGGTPPYTYSWSNLATTQSINGLIPGCYFVNVTDANGCQKAGTYCVAEGGCNLSVSVTGTNSSSNSIYTGSGTAVATISGGNPPYDITWNTGATTASISNLAVGSYSVLITEQSNPNCATWGYFTVYGSAGGPVGIIDNSSLNSPVIIYPNPSNGIFSIKSEIEISTIEIVNVHGEKIYSAKINSNKADIDIEKQPKGIYFYQIKSENKILKTGKIIVE